MFLGNGKVKFEFAHVGINAQTPEEGARMKDFFTDVMGYHDYRDNQVAYFTVDNKMELMKIMGKGTMGHLGFFVNDMPAAIEYLEEKLEIIKEYAEDTKTPVIEIPFEVPFRNILSVILEHLFNEEVIRLKYFKTMKCFRFGSV